jgi:hypothetical protein
MNYSGSIKASINLNGDVPRPVRIGFEAISGEISVKWPTCESNQIVQMKVDTFGGEIGFCNGGRIDSSDMLTSYSSAGNVDITLPHDFARKVALLRGGGTACIDSSLMQRMEMLENTPEHRIIQVKPSGSVDSAVVSLATSSEQNELRIGTCKVVFLRYAE